MTLWPLVAALAVFLTWHRVGQWLYARQDAREYADKLTAYAAETRKAHEETRRVTLDLERVLGEVSSRMGRAEMALRER